LKTAAPAIEDGGKRTDRIEKGTGVRVVRCKRVYASEGLGNQREGKSEGGGFMRWPEGSEDSRKVGEADQTFNSAREGDE